MDIKKKFIRSANFTNGEKDLLIAIVCQYTQVVECKQTDGKTNTEKKRAWDMIAREFNSRSLACGRTAFSLRSCYHNEKKKVKRPVWNEKTGIFKIDGGTDQISKMTGLLHEQVFGFKPETLALQENIFDNPDAYTRLTEQTSANACSSSQRVQNEDNIVDEDLEVMPLPFDFIDVSSQYNIPTVASQPIPIPVPNPPPQDWSNYTLKMLRTPSHKTVISVPLRNLVCLPPGEIKKIAPIPESATPRQAKSSSPKPMKTQWTSRVRPSLPNPPVAEATVKFETLGAAKFELMKIQLQAAADEATRRKAREDEEHEMRKAVHVKVIAEYERREKLELEVHGKKMQILKAEFLKVSKP